MDFPGLKSETWDTQRMGFVVSRSPNARDPGVPGFGADDRATCRIMGKVSVERGRAIQRQMGAKE